MSAAEPSFEEAFRQLEETLRVLERGGLSLEEAVSLYERGLQLVRCCNELLDRAELRISQIAVPPPPEEAEFEEDEP